MAVAPVKYQFDTAFGEEAREREAAEIERLRRQVDQARDQGRREGFAAGRAEALSEIEAQIAAVLERVPDAFAALAEQRATLEAKLERQAAQLAHAIAARLAPALMESRPLAEIEALVADCLDGSRREPRVVVRVAEALVEPLKARLEPLKLANSFAGQIILLGEADLGDQDCRVEWPDGGAERDMAALEKDIAAAVERFVMSAEDDAVPAVRISAAV